VGPPISRAPPVTTSLRPVQTTVASVRGAGASWAEIGVQRSATGSYSAPSPSKRTEPGAVVATRPPQTSSRDPVQATALGSSRGEGAPAAAIFFQDLRARSSTAPSPSTPTVCIHPPQTSRRRPSSATA